MKWIFWFFAPLLILASPQEEIYEIFKIPPSASQEEVLKTAQHLWMQQGKERWQFQSRYEHLRPQLWPLFRQLGMVEKIAPSRNHYDTVLVLGALLSRVQMRVDFLIHSGATFDHLVFLSGDRPLLDSEREMLPDLKTESEMVRWVFEHSQLPKDVSVLFIEVPMKGARRPNTLDTIQAWLQTDPHPTSCLVISSQPYVHFQGAVFNRLVSFPVETAGSAIEGDPTVDLMLDTLAREMTYKYGDIEWLQR